MKTENPEDPQREGLRDRLESILLRTEKANSWHDEAARLRGLLNHEGYVPIRTRLVREDLEFLAGARPDLLRFSELGLRLLDLHQPRDAGGITSDAAHPILRCRSCMWRWPCPTFRAMLESFGPQRETTDSQDASGTPAPPADDTSAAPAQPAADQPAATQPAADQPASLGRQTPATISTGAAGSRTGTPARR
ncbi:hypothetical protein Nocox_00655 [Nonomuraea coxensis DSM 45129]|uniref:Uncharacterized protein n=2 Tax=Nonomuraea coxensis TaxID=404386 RepID=A0ABX8TU03_9ACTN|nr:hypothetical protein Nocox_00655 [Nonomuraea coxensis DSM 45129]